MSSEDGGVEDRLARTANARTDRLQPDEQSFERNPRLHEAGPLTVP